MAGAGNAIGMYGPFPRRIPQLGYPVAAARPVVSLPGYVLSIPDSHDALAQQPGPSGLPGVIIFAQLPSPALAVRIAGCYLIVLPEPSNARFEPILPMMSPRPTAPLASGQYTYLIYLPDQPIFTGLTILPTLPIATIAPPAVFSRRGMFGRGRKRFLDWI